MRNREDFKGFLKILKLLKMPLRSIAKFPEKIPKNIDIIQFFMYILICVFNKRIF